MARGKRLAQPGVWIHKSSAWTGLWQWGPSPQQGPPAVSSQLSTQQFRPDHPVPWLHRPRESTTYIDALKRSEGPADPTEEREAARDIKLRDKPNIVQRPCVERGTL